jgi:hypothetical protein
MGNCLNCRFWAPSDFEDALDKLGYGKCEGVGEQCDGYHNHTEPMAPAQVHYGASDDTSLFANFRTKATFGCTMFQKKP